MRLSLRKMEDIEVFAGLVEDAVAYYGEAATKNAFVDGAPRGGADNVQLRDSKSAVDKDGGDGLSLLRKVEQLRELQRSIRTQKEILRTGLAGDRTFSTDAKDYVAAMLGSAAGDSDVSFGGGSADGK